MKLNTTATTCKYNNCNKSILIPITCKCGATFCSKHIKYRQPQLHDCKYDYRKEFKDVLTKNNPQVINDKIERF